MCLATCVSGDLHNIIIFFLLVGVGLTFCHNVFPTLAHPCEPSAPIMTVNAPPGYYTASAQPAPPQPPQGAFETPKPGQYQQFQNEPI